MSPRPQARPDWRTLSRAEKQRRLERLRRAQQDQLARDARVLRLVRA
jgi:hypothetical protein